MEPIKVRDFGLQKKLATHFVFGILAVSHLGQLEVY